MVCQTWMCMGRVWWFCVFFFKQKTAYEMLRSLVGSEMCIRDRVTGKRLYRLGSPGVTPLAGNALRIL